MKLVIDIPEILYTKIQNGKADKRTLETVILHGTPLPKGHGRLIDADFVKNTLDLYILNEYNGQFIRRNDIDSIPTIIEAESEDEK